MNDTVQLSVELGERSYPIFVGERLWQGQSEGGSETLVSKLGRQRHLMIVTDETVAELHLSTVVNAMTKAGWNVDTATVPEGEPSKSLARAKDLYSKLLQSGVRRDGIIMALGGGVVGDLAGFVAATYMRGIRMVHAPTTLLAQVDSSIGGKVGVNLPQGKNLVGAFHQPALVLTDVDMLRTLDPEEVRYGMAEVVKSAVLGSAEFFDCLEPQLDTLLDRTGSRFETSIWKRIVARTAEIKANVVSRDELDRGVRMHLNLGHTFGHGLELVGSYGRFAHGEAVAWGMSVAARLSAMLGKLPSSEEERLHRALDLLGLPTMIADVEPGEIFAAMKNDKKRPSKGKGTTQVPLILPVEIGRVEVVSDVPRELVLEAIGSRIADPA